MGKSIPSLVPRRRSHNHNDLINMNRRKPIAVKTVPRSKPLVVGFLPENDCAPIVVAQEMGFFKKYGLHVELQREMSWKNIHDKIIHRQIDAGQAPAALPLTAEPGFGAAKTGPPGYRSARKPPRTMNLRMIDTLRGFAGWSPLSKRKTHA